MKNYVINLSKIDVVNIENDKTVGYLTPDIENSQVLGLTLNEFIDAAEEYQQAMCSSFIGNRNEAGRLARLIKEECPSFAKIFLNELKKDYEGSTKTLITALIQSLDECESY